MIKKNKKIIAVICLILTLFTAFPLQTFATFITDMNSDAEFGVVEGSLAEYKHELHYANYDGATYLLFCIEFGKKSPTGKAYVYGDEFWMQFKGDRPELEKIAEMIYFGYTMKYGMGLPESYEAKRDACATQQYVWEQLGNAPARDSWNANYMSYGIYDNWIADTEAKYNQYHSKVSFNGEIRATSIGETTVFSDVNGVLARFESFSKTINGVNFNHENGSNDLIITVANDANNGIVSFNSSEYGIYQLMPNGAKYSKDTMSNYMYFEFSSGKIQNLMFSNYVAPSMFNVSVEIQSGRIQVQKYNNIGNPVANCSFDLYADESCSQKISSGITNAEGQIVFDKLKTGAYWVKETSVPNGYLIDTNIKRVDVENGQMPIVEFRNTEPTGRIIIQKISEYNDKLTGAVFTIKADEEIKNKAGTKTFYTKGQEVAQITTENGVAQVDNLPLGKYTINEIQAPKGYLLNEKTFTAELKYKDENTPVIELMIEGIVDNEPKGTIGIIKKDSKTGSIAQGDATLKDAVYNVYAAEDVYNVAKTKKFYSKGELVATRTTNERGEANDITELPLGKYIVKEEKAPTGYLIDKKEYEVNLSYKDQYTKVITGNAQSTDKVKEMKVHIFKSGIKVNSGETPGLAGSTFTIKLNSSVQKAYNEGYTYEEVWGGFDELGNKVEVNSQRMQEAQKIAPTYEEVETDENGNAYTKYLPFGTYIVKEAITPKDYESASDFTFTISEDESEIEDIARKVKNIVVNNEQLEVYIKLIKQDLKTGKIVSLNNATFQIKATKDIYDRATGKLLYKEGEAVSQKVGSTIYNSFTTNAKNIVIPDKSYSSSKEELGTVITPLKLEVGAYEITEIKTPKGFLQLEIPVEFTVDGIRDYDKDQYGDFIKEVIIKNEQPSGTLIVNKSVALRGNADTSIVNVSDLSKIEFELTAKEDIINYADGSVIYKRGQKINKYNPDKIGNLKIENLPLGVYELVETKTLDGLVLNTTKYEVKFEQKDLITKVYENKLNISNDTTLVEFSKTDVTGNKELEGAKLTVLDESGKTIDTWISSNKTHKIEGLVAGKNYTLKEEIAPNGFVKATEIKFRVDDNKEIQKVKMIDKVVEITKTDITNNSELEGAELEVIDKKGNIVDKWVSAKEPHIVSGLEEKKTYKLIEKTAPYGYEIAEEIEFKVSADKTNKKIEMKDRPILKDIKVIKIDSKTKEIIRDNFTFGLYADEQCTLLIQQMDSERKEGTVTFKDLRYGTYYIKEVNAPEGYLKSNDVIKVEINDKGAFMNGMQVQESAKNVYTIEFENWKIVLPHTGEDRSMRGALIALVVLSFITFAVGGFYKYKSKGINNKKIKVRNK